MPTQPNGPHRTNNDNQRWYPAPHAAPAELLRPPVSASTPLATGAWFADDPTFSNNSVPDASVSRVRGNHTTGSQHPQLPPQVLRVHMLGGPKRHHDFPLSRIHRIPPGLQTFEQLVLCPLYNPVHGYDSCPLGVSCRMVHADTRGLDDFDVHVNFAWRLLAEVTYHRYPAGESLYIAPPNSRNPTDVVDSSYVLVTRALASKRRPLTHCAHYYLNRQCNMGSECRFVHVVRIVPVNVLQQPSAAMQSPHPQQNARAPTHVNPRFGSDVETGLSASTVSACVASGAVSQPWQLSFRPAIEGRQYSRGLPRGNLQQPAAQGSGAGTSSQLAFLQQWTAGRPPPPPPPPSRGPLQIPFRYDPEQTDRQPTSAPPRRPGPTGPAGPRRSHEPYAASPTSGSPLDDHLRNPGSSYTSSRRR
jgi:hypothetical protein